MSIPIGATTAVTASKDRWKFVTCEQCRTEFSYCMERSVTISGFNFLFLDGVGAARGARERARSIVERKLNHEEEPVPCPQCGWIQTSMHPFVRRSYLAWMGTTGFLTLAIGLAFLVGIFLSGEYSIIDFSDPIFLGLAAIAPIGLGLLHLRWSLAARHDPNAVDVDVRKRRGAERALLRQALEQEARSVQTYGGAYWPLIEDSMIVWGRKLGSHRIILEEKIEAHLGTFYKYLMRVCTIPGHELELCIAAERSVFEPPSARAKEVYTLALYLRGATPIALSIAPEWADLKTFESRALALVYEYLEIPEPSPDEA